ncbi:hypothetical protein H6F89_34310 [Cyanobacteria bacterium FACHB-63]|nr:hypothetical protein [Cyanobacteria bacterium FACHB-63]
MPTPENSSYSNFSEESFSALDAGANELEEIFLPITASISPQILTKVTCLFNASLEDILNECFQNARSAGATQVEVLFTEQRTLRIEDNGCGIESPQMLLNLGQSDWDQTVVESEDPAGMGVFSLANRGAVISSQDWQVQLNPEHFSGQSAAIVQSSAARVGTRIEFPLLEAEVRSLPLLIESAARYYPLSIKFNGAALPQQDFLEDAMVVKSWRGLRLGVSAHHRWADRVGEGALNFYGLTVHSHLPSLACNDTPLRVRVDVDTAPELKLVLPARKEVVQNAFFDELKVELRRTLYEAVATLEHHNLSYVRWLEARSFGIDLPPARPYLEVFKPQTGDYLAGEGWGSSHPVNATTMRVDAGELPTSEQQLLARALSNSDLPYTFVATEDKYQGYGWYDALPKLSSTRFEIEIENQVFSPAEFGELYTQNLNVLVDRITVIVMQTQVGQPDTELRFPLDVGFSAIDEAAYNGSINEVTLAIAQH